MLTLEQERMLEILTDEYVDNQVLVNQKEVEGIIRPMRSDPDFYNRWNVWNALMASSTPVINGSSLAPPQCQHDGTTPCASCDCC